MRSGHVRVMQVRGVPVFFHWTAAFNLLAGLPAVMYQPWAGVVTAACLVSVLLVHEAGHAFVARRRRCSVYWIELRAFHGLTSYGQPASSRDAVAIAWGGVLAQGLIAIAAYGVMSVWGGMPNMVAGAAFRALGLMNLLIAAINLLPVAGLDGETAWRILRRRPKWRPPKTALRGTR